MRPNHQAWSPSVVSTCFPSPQGFPITTQPVAWVKSVWSILDSSHFLNANFQATSKSNRLWKAEKDFNPPNPEYSLEALLLKLKLQYSGNLTWRADSLEKTLMLQKIEGKRRKGGKGWDGWIPIETQWAWIWANSGRQWRTGKPGMLQSMGSQRVRHDLATEQQQPFIYTFTKSMFFNMKIRYWISSGGLILSLK